MDPIVPGLQRIPRALQTRTGSGPAVSRWSVRWVFTASLAVALSSLKSSSPNPHKSIPAVIKRGRAGSGLKAASSL